MEVDGCNKLCMIVVNQVIDNIGDQYNPIPITGGRGLRHGKHLALYVKKSGGGERDEHGFTSTQFVFIALTKNKVSPVIASFPVIFSKSKGFIPATALLEYLLNVKYFKDAGSWKKFTMPKKDDQGDLTGEVEEISIQRGTFYKLIEQRPEVAEFLAEEVKRMFLEKFPFSKRLTNLDVHNIIHACLEIQGAMPDEGEESVVVNPVIPPVPDVTLATDQVASSEE